MIDTYNIGYIPIKFFDKSNLKNEVNWNILVTSGK